MPLPADQASRPEFPQREFAISLAWLPGSQQPALRSCYKLRLAQYSWTFVIPTVAGWEAFQTCTKNIARGNVVRPADLDRNLLFRSRIPAVIPLLRQSTRRKEHLCRKSQRLRHERPAIRYRPCVARLIERPRRQFLRHFSLLSLPVIGIMLNAASRSVCRQRQ